MKGIEEWLAENHPEVLPWQVHVMTRVVNEGDTLVLVMPRMYGKTTIDKVIGEYREQLGLE